MKSNNRKNNQLSAKKRRKLTEQYKKGGGKSQYALKHAYLSKNGLWGFEVKHKPWKKASKTVEGSKKFIEDNELVI